MVDYEASLSREKLGSPLLTAFRGGVIKRLCSQLGGYLEGCKLQPMVRFPSGGVERRNIDVFFMAKMLFFRKGLLATFSGPFKMDVCIRKLIELLLC